jgi:uncharacterized protein with HEPN domain
MVRRAVFRLRDVKQSIVETRSLLADKSLDQVQSDAVTLAAFERFLERMSEAVRHIPEEWKAAQPKIPWRRIADLGNQIRHAYFRIQPDVLWAIYANDLDTFEQAIDLLLVEHDR